MTTVKAKKVVGTKTVQKRRRGRKKRKYKSVKKKRMYRELLMELYPYNDDLDDYITRGNPPFMINIIPEPDETESRQVGYRWIQLEELQDDPKLYRECRRFVSNNWRKVHGYPLRRKDKSSTMILKPILFSEETTKRVKESYEEIDRLKKAADR